jgi:hypothetical protein
MIALVISLILSVGINIFLIVYLRWILKKMSFLSENIGDMLTSLDAFSVHLESVHQLETYYGDATLKNLIVHSKQIVKDVELYRDIYTLFHDDESVELEKLFEREELYATEALDEKIE